MILKDKIKLQMLITHHTTTRTQKFLLNKLHGQYIISMKLSNSDNSKLGVFCFQKYFTKSCLAQLSESKLLQLT